MTTLKIGTKVMVGRFYNELAKAEIAAIGPEGAIVELHSKYQDYPKGTLLRAGSLNILPVDMPSTGSGTKVVKAPVADADATKPAKASKKADENATFKWAEGAKVLFGSKKHPIRGEVVRHGRKSGRYVVKALETYGKVTAGKEVYVVEAEIRQDGSAPAPRAPRVRKGPSAAQDQAAA